jgi:hypothetical protein
MDRHDITARVTSTEERELQGIFGMIMNVGVA